MDFMRTLLAYMAATLLVAVESTATPGPAPTPTPTPEGMPPAIVETITEIPTETPEPTVSVTPVPVPTITANTKAYHNLAQGDKGNDVRKLQERLIELGYLPEGAADGAYGGQTRNAVRRFQYYNSLTVDGIAGRATQTNLFENPDIVPMPTATPSPTPAESSEPTPAAEEGVTPAPEGTENTKEKSEAPAEETEAPAEATEAPAEATEAPEEVTEAPAEETEAPAEVIEAPAEETEAPAEVTEAPAEETEAPAEVTEAPAEETEAPEEVTEAPAEERQEIIEHVNLDDSYQEINANIVLNDSGAPMEWLALEDGVSVRKKPRIQEREGNFRISLKDVVECVDGWELTDDGNTVVLQAAGYTLGLYNESAGMAATVDGIEREIAPQDYDFSAEGNFIDAAFLCGALNGTYEWDGEEFTLMLRIPHKDVSKATD